MWTAENLTDEIVRAFLDEEQMKPAVDCDAVSVRLAFVALGRIVPSKGTTKRQARARVAELLNARAAKAGGK